MPGMKLGAGRIGKHLQDVFFGLVAVLIELVQIRLRPFFLPLFFDVGKLVLQN